MADTYYKQPSEVLDYDVDYSEWIPSGDTIASKTVTAESGITVDSSSINSSTHVIKVWLSGGTDGTLYKVTVLATTTAGRSKEKEFYVRVRDE